MDKIPTAEEFLLKHVKNPNLTSNFTKILIKFSKLHVEAALKEACENIIIEGHPFEYELDKNSILSAYPLENIK